MPKYLKQSESGHIWRTIQMMDVSSTIQGMRNFKSSPEQRDLNTHSKKNHNPGKLLTSRSRTTLLKLKSRCGSPCRFPSFEIRKSDHLNIWPSCRTPILSPFMSVISKSTDVNGRVSASGRCGEPARPDIQNCARSVTTAARSCFDQSKSVARHLL